MSDIVHELSRPRGSYGVDGDYRLIPPAVVAAGYLLLCALGAGLTVYWAVNGAAVSARCLPVLSLSCWSGRVRA